MIKLHDVLVLVGLAFIIYATFKINVIAGYYALGISQVVIGVLLALLYEPSDKKGGDGQEC